MKNSSDWMHKEWDWIPPLLGLFPLVAFSGLVTYYAAGNALWEQWTYLLHSFSGVFLGAVLLPYTLFHFRRTLGLRRPFVSILGILSVLVILSLLGSGLHIMVLGQSEPLRWVKQVHTLTAHLTLIFLAVHLLGHRLFFTKPRRGKKEGRTLKIQDFKISVVTVLIALGTITGASIASSLYPSAYRDEALIQPYETPYGNHPFRPSQTETLRGGFVDARRIAGSDQCGVCHTQIAKQWQASIHSQAASDPAYVKNINLLAHNKGMAATRYCEGCHAPIALLSGQLTQGGFHGGKANTLAHREGVSCMSCHGIDQVVHLKGVGSFRFAPKAEVLFADREHVILRKLHNFLIRIHPEAHRQDMTRPPLSSSQLCATCHAQFMDQDMNNWGWVKMQDEYTAWLDSPYSGQSDQTFAHHTLQRCQDCHMPLVSGADPSADENGQIRSHTFPGANTAIPWVTGDPEQLQLIREFLQAGKIRVAIEAPQRQDATRSEKITQATARFETEPPAYFYLGEDAAIKVSVTNVGVGHDFPGGTIDINQAWIWFLVRDAEHRTVYESGGLQTNRDVDPDAHFYRSLPIDRYRQPVWRHDLFNMVGESFRNVIKAGRTDIVEYTFPIPFWVNGPLTVSAVLRYRKFNNRYARWALDNATIDLPIVDMARDALILPVRTKPVVE